MRRAPTGRDTARAVPDTSGDDSAPDHDDWIARHARTRGPTDGSNVRADDPGDDWGRRHRRTRR
jgi:hypothetical protein